MKTSDVQASVGRVVHVYCPELWQGPMPGLVVGESRHFNPDTHPFLGGEETAQFLGGGPLNVCNVNVQVDGARFFDAVSALRARPQGATFSNVLLFDAPVVEAERHLVHRASPAIDNGVGGQYVAWAEWPPFVPAGNRYGGPVVGEKTAPAVPPSLRMPEPPTPKTKVSEPAETETPVHVPADEATAAAVAGEEIESIGDPNDQTKAGEPAAVDSGSLAKPE